MRRVYTPKSPREQVKEILLSQIRSLRQSIDPALLKKVEEAAIAARGGDGGFPAAKMQAGPTIPAQTGKNMSATPGAYAAGGLSDDGETTLSYDRKHAAATVAAYLNLNRNLDRAQLVEIIKMVKDIR